MEDVLPSYESAVGRDYWSIIAPYIQLNDICSAILVSRRWYEIFAPHLWGNPASHFGVEGDRVYIAITRFMRALPSARIYARQLTHTLHLSPAHAELYGGPHDEWLRDTLESLPNLQSLVVSGVPFIDHGSLITLRYPSLTRRTVLGGIAPTFSLRLLHASSCLNAAPSGLAEALLHFPGLVSLDLSRTVAANSELVLKTLRRFNDLRVLKLRGIELKDEGLAIVASSIGTHVQYLDIGENRLTDKSADNLVQVCFPVTEASADGSNAPISTFQSTSSNQSQINGLIEDLDESIYRSLTSGFVGDTTIDGDGIGITHLHLDDNLLTVDGMARLIKTRRLQMLDVGAIRSNEIQEAVPLLVPILVEYAKHLIRLRIGYQIVAQEKLGTTQQTSDITTAETCSGNYPSKLDSDQSRLEGKQLRKYLHPANLSKIRTLIFTGIPPTTEDPYLPTRFIQFLQGCAEQARTAKICAKSSYELAPGRNRNVAEIEYAYSIFSLRRIILEVAPPVSIQTPVEGAYTGWGQAKSSSEDPDSDALWVAAENDFSFFREEENATSFELRPSLNTPQSSVTPFLSSQRKVIPTFDTISELSKFRKDKRERFSAALAKGSTDPVIEGYWPGEIRVIRHQN